MSSCLTPLLKQGHWGNLFQCLMSLTVQRRSFLFRWNLPCFSLSHCLLSCQWALLKIAWLYLLSSLPLDICMHWWHFPWIFSSPGYTVPVLPGFPHRRNAPLPSSSLWPFIGLSKVCLRVSCTGGPRTWHSTLDGASSVLSRWEGSPCLTYWQLCLMQLSIPLAFFVTRAHYWLMSYLVSPGPFLQIFFPPGWPPAHPGALFLLRSQTLHFLLNLMRFLPPLSPACPGPPG